MDGFGNHIIGLLRASKGSVGVLLVDVTGFGAMANLVEKGFQHAARRLRKLAFERLLEEEDYRWVDENIIVMEGAHPNETELQTAVKLSKTDEYYVVFPSDGQIKEIRMLTNEFGAQRNDVFLVDRMTYKTIAADIKTCGDPSVETIIAHLSCGVNQAQNLVLDITGKIEKAKLLLGLRRGWSKNLRYVYLNYHGQWYLLDRIKVYDKNWIPKNVK
jgi:hypothetical protein